MQLQENKSIGDPTTQSTTSCVSSHKIGDSCVNVEVKPVEEKEDICSSVCRPAEVEGNNGGGATPLEDKLDTRGQVSGISTDGKPNLTSPSMDRNKSFECDREEIGDGSICTSNIKIGDGSDCTAASGRKLQKLLVEDPMSGPVGKEELGSASATDQQQLPSLDAGDESVVAVVSLTADNVPSPKAVDESMTRKSENSGIDYFKLGDVAKEKNSISTSSTDEPPTSKIAGESHAHVISKLEFDLNEGISGVDANEGEPAVSTAIVCSSVIRWPSLSPFANPMLRMRLDGKAQQPLVHFGQQNHETFLEIPPNSLHMPPSYFARKQGRPLLDNDLNVAGEGVLEDMASESSSQTTVSISGTLLTSSSHRLEAPILPTQPASGAFPGGEASVLRNFDLNDRPVSQRILSVTGGGNSLNDDYRGSALSSSPAMTFASVTSLSYARLPFASGYPISSTSFSGCSTSYVDSSLAGGSFFPAFPSLLVRPPSAVLSHYPRVA
ncbi:hypothetical protein C4D60_Mb10t26250 [Musa balbisiana]|uniref:Uncharacterized protein n=1 Tax=Musa balbisiana TaxID=52838 RepID=A0A4S8IZV3_MUSBA|nr:hypothetical protein C4D60_Mb10t26250 [Musa balbisiana]